MASLAKALRALVRRAIASGVRVRRLDVGAVSNQGIHTISDGTSAPVSGRQEFRAGDVVDLLEAPSPLILGHRVQKGDVPSLRVREDLEEVEEIVMTLSSNPDGGVDHFLRSPFGLFYLDLRTAVMDAVPSWQGFVSSGTLFPSGSTPFVRFGQRDNTIGVMVAFGGPPDSSRRLVVYVFRLSRPLHDPHVRSRRRTTIAGHEYRIADLSLIGFYDLAELSLDPGLSVGVSGPVRVRQLLPVYARDRVFTWTGSAYEGPAVPFVSFALETVVEVAPAFSIGYSPLLDLAHNDQRAEIGPALLDTVPQPYSWRLVDFSLDPQSRPVLAIELRNTWSSESVSDLKAHDATGALVPLSQLDLSPFDPNPRVVFRPTFGPWDFGERPLLVVRLAQDSLAGGVRGTLLGRSCDEILHVSAETDAVTFSLVTDLLNVTRLLGNLKETTRFVGGPQDGEASTDWALQRFEVAGSLSVDAVEVSAYSIVTFSPKAYGWSGLKPALLTLFADTRAIGVQFSTTQYITGLAVLFGGFETAPFEAIKLTTATVGFVTGGAPTTSILHRPDGRSRGAASVNHDLVLLLRRKLTGLLNPPTSNNFVFPVEEITGLWRLSPDTDVGIPLAVAAEATPVTTLQKPLLNRNTVLVESPIEAQASVVRLTDLSRSPVPADLLGPVGQVLTVLAPDRIYDLRDTVGRFRSPTNLSAVLRGPTRLPSIDALIALTLDSNPPRAVHTVGARTGLG